MTDLRTAPDAEHDPAEGLPETWTESARETYLQIEAATPAMTPADAAALFEACNLIALADDMEARVKTDGLMVTGSTGQPVPHGLLSEIRLSRSQAIAALRPFATVHRSPASASGAALARRRWGAR